MFDLKNVRKTSKKSFMMCTLTAMTLKEVVTLMRTADSELNYNEETQIIQDAHRLMIFKITRGMYNKKSFEDVKNDYEFVKIALH